ncbi:MFS transporter [Nonomuraea sp. FMUSA5-5]|uniref:MFS transporter n=1 Tax=Nonomuraea composti TaxID=2720023 RepID=A0ABX1AW74_9ACTN|nr:MFS transporter [Nonomuraea sp. FMUSA5-5]NJP89875.1 MFS transporter [Nonomuraea sp. FMUSA5-5]
MVKVVRAAVARGPVGKLPRLFWVLWSGTLINRAGYVVQPFLAIYLSGRWQLSPVLIGTVISTFGAGAMLSPILGGQLADRVGRRRMLIAGMLASAGTMLLIPFATHVVAIALAVGVYGLAVDLYRPAVSALIADTVAPADRSRAFGLLYWAVNLGTAVAGVAGGWLATRSFWLLFAINAVACLSFATIAARLVPADLPRPRRTTWTRFTMADGLLVSLTLAFFLCACLLVQAYVALPIVMTGQGFDSSAYGLVLAVNPVVVVVLQPLLLRRLTALPPLAVFAAAIALTGAGFGLTGLAATMPAYAATVLVWTVGEIAVAAVGPALVAEIAPPDMQGRYSGFFNAAYGAASLAAPVSSSFVLQEHGAAALWTACLVTGAAGAGIAMALAPALRRRRLSLSVTEHAPEQES